MTKQTGTRWPICIIANQTETTADMEKELPKQKVIENASSLRKISENTQSIYQSLKYSPKDIFLPMDKRIGPVLMY